VVARYSAVVRGRLRFVDANLPGCVWGEPRPRLGIGYGIITDAARISGGVTRLQTGTLYMALDRLRSAGLAEPDREEVAEGRLRRYYRTRARRCWRPRPNAVLGHLPRMDRAYTDRQDNVTGRLADAVALGVGDRGYPVA
jgi:Transcriptional regulator PadR-like family